MMTMTTQYRGQTPGRARLATSGVRSMHLPTMGSWQGDSPAPAFLGCDTTGLVAFPTNAYVANHTTEACAKGFNTIKRTARHLGTGST